MSRANGEPRVGYVLRKFPVLSETFVLNELLALEARGVPLHLFSLQRPNDPRFHDDLPRLRASVSYVPGLSEMRKLLRHHRRAARIFGRRYLKTLFYAARAARPTLFWRLLQAAYVAREGRRLGLTHLHAQFANRPTTVAHLAAQLAGIPFSFTAHATDIFKDRVSRRALARKVEAARFVVTVSEFNRAYLERVSGAPSGKIVLIHNGIDIERFAPNGVPAREPFTILSVARLVEKKGLPDLIEACRRLRDRGLEFRCGIVGKGILRSQLESLIRRRKLGDRVRLLGPHTQGEVLERYRAAHLYVLPSIVGSDGNREGLPVSIVEALAAGLPVVSTRVTGIPEVVRHGENGLLVESGDARALAGAIESLMRDRALYDRLRANARASVLGRFDLRETSARLHALLSGSGP